MPFPEILPRAPGRPALDAVIGEAAAWLLERQNADGHWVFELEADATIPAEYILLNHFLDEIDDGVERKLAAYLRATQAPDGGWPLFHGGAPDLSATIKAYYALKMVGDDIDAQHMDRARALVREMGGAGRCNVFTRIALALFGQMSWRTVPVIRAEAVLLPKWSPFHLDKVSYWSRTVMVPLMVLATLKPLARNPRGIGVQELFLDPADRDEAPLPNPTGDFLGSALIALDRALRPAEALMPKALERKALDRAMAFVRERLNGEDGLGGIFPAIANSLMAMDALGVPRGHPDRDLARNAADRLLVLGEESGYCQPCLSPVWDTALACLALAETGLPEAADPSRRAAVWLAGRQVTEVAGDWAAKRPGLRPGGWAFQYRNDHYPDVDDTAVVAIALERAAPDAHAEAIDRAVEWVVGMQSRNGGWGAFDPDNTHFFLNAIPFADHGALLDPPTADVSARCLSLLSRLGDGKQPSVVDRALNYLWAEQEADGSWFGRWGTNYIYGTWSALCALNAAGVSPADPRIRKAVAWLKARQHEDGGWGEDCASYWPEGRAPATAALSTPSQTAWALLGLMAVGEAASPEVLRGVSWLLDAPRQGGKWGEEHYTAVGFPRVFYLRYHGYSSYFPLWALARYRALTAGNSKGVPWRL